MAGSVATWTPGGNHLSLATMWFRSSCFSRASASWSALRLWKRVAFGRFIQATAWMSIPSGQLHSQSDRRLVRLNECSISIDEQRSPRS